MENERYMVLIGDEVVAFRNRDFQTAMEDVKILFDSMRAKNYDGNEMTITLRRMTGWEEAR